MVAQTQVKSSAGDTLAPLAVARGTGEVLVDALTLAELQFQLAELDLQDAKRRLQGGMVLVAAGAVLGVSAIPLLLGACALALTKVTQMELYVALFIMVGAALIVSGAILVWGSRKLKLKGLLFARSRSEWRQNAKWLKAMLRQSGSPRRPAPEEDA
jgi:cytochrome c biogenesis protein CcdA